MSVPLFTEKDLDDYWLSNQKDEFTMLVIKDERNELKVKEASLLRKETCQISKLHNYRNLISNINSDNLSLFLRNNFYNYQAMMAIRCLINSLSYHQNDDLIDKNIWMRHWINHLTQIGTDIENDIDNSFTASFGHNGKDPIFLIRTPQHPDADLLHEAFVGLYGTNKLRQTIPNFAFIFSHFRCSPAISQSINNNHPVIAWCNNTSSNVDYVVYENIVPSITLEKYLEKCSGFDFLNIYLQILYALSSANRLIDFTHFNLDYTNIILRFLPDIENFYIPYNNNGKNIIYILTKYIPTIINYETAYIKYDGEDFPSSLIVNWIWKSFPIYDAYLLLTSSLHKMLRLKNTSCYETIIPLLKFFISVKDERSFLDSDYLFKLPDKFSNVPISNLINYINNKYILKWQTNDPSDEYPILSCHLGECLSVNEIDKEINLVNPIKIKDLFDLLDFLSHNKENTKQIIESVNYKQILINASQDFQNITDEIKKEKIVSLNLLGLSLDEIKNIFNRYEQYILSVISLYDNYDKMNSLYKNILLTINYLPKIEIIRKMIEIVNELYELYDQPTKNFIINKKNSIIDDKNYLVEKVSERQSIYSKYEDLFNKFMSITKELEELEELE